MHLEQENLDIVLEILQKYVPKYEVWAFGSRVTGKHLRKFSDLDLAVITDKPLPNYSKIKEAFSMSDLPIRVDVVDWASASDSFKDIIKENCEVIQKAQ